MGTRREVNRALELREQYDFAAQQLTLYLALLEVWDTAEACGEAALPLIVRATREAGPEPLAAAVEAIEDPPACLRTWLDGGDLPPVERYVARAALRGCAFGGGAGSAVHGGRADSVGSTLHSNAHAGGESAGNAHADAGGKSAGNGNAHAHAGGESAGNGNAHAHAGGESAGSGNAHAHAHAGGESAGSGNGSRAIALHPKTQLTDAVGCPRCGGLPQLSYREPGGEPLVSGERQLLCSRCWQSWKFSASTCPSCGESSGAKRTIYSDAKELPHLRIEACATCERYLIDVDRGRDPKAVPEVDELAAVPLDLYASDLGLTKITPNLMGF